MENPELLRRDLVISTEIQKNSSDLCFHSPEVSVHSSEEFFHPSEEIVIFQGAICKLLRRDASHRKMSVRGDEVLLVVRSKMSTFAEGVLQIRLS